MSERSRREMDESGDERCSVIDRELPSGFSERARQFYDLEVPPVTVGDWIDAVAEAVTEQLGRPPSRDDLCYVDASRHVALTDAGVFHYRCPLDALLYAILEETAVTVRSRSPTDDESVLLHATPSATTAVPEEGILSLGIGHSASCDGPVADASYAAICPFVNAFPTQSAYERWADDCDGETVPIPFVDAHDVATALVGSARSS